MKKKISKFLCHDTQNDVKRPEKCPDGCVFSFFLNHFSGRLESLEQIFKAFKSSNI